MLLRRRNAMALIGNLLDELLQMAGDNTHRVKVCMERKAERCRRNEILSELPRLWANLWQVELKW